MEGAHLDGVGGLFSLRNHEKLITPEYIKRECDVSCFGKILLVDSFSKSMFLVLGVGAPENLS